MTGAELALLAGQLTQRWNQLIWGQVARLLAEGDPSPPVQRQTPVRKQMQLRLSEARWDQILAEYEAGATCAVLADKYGVHWQTVLSRLKARGIAPRLAAPQRRLTGERLDQAIAMRHQGLTYGEIGERVGVSTSTVSRALSRATTHET